MNPAPLPLTQITALQIGSVLIAYTTWRMIQGQRTSDRLILVGYVGGSWVAGLVVASLFLASDSLGPYKDLCERTIHINGRLVCPSPWSLTPCLDCLPRLLRARGPVQARHGAAGLPHHAPLRLLHGWPVHPLLLPAPVAGGGHRRALDKTAGGGQGREEEGRVGIRRS